MFKLLPIFTSVTTLFLSVCVSNIAANAATLSDRLVISQKQPSGGFKPIFSRSLDEGSNDQDSSNGKIDSGTINNIPIESVFGTFPFVNNTTNIARLVEGPSSTRVSNEIKLTVAQEPTNPGFFQFRVILQSDTDQNPFKPPSVDRFDPSRYVEDGGLIDLTNFLFFGQRNLPDTAANPPAIKIEASSDENINIPEPSTTLGLLTLGTLGAASTLKVFGHCKK
jgi:hypothetical protein